ncbi:MAG: enoyl-[acyl-carrier-protein] reductase [Gemmatimonadota bacterium]|jgi:enoyl-[acyl-carrier protein] reductase I
MLPIDLTGKRAFVAGVADDQGYGWAIVRALAQAGASICVGTWPPTMKIFTKSLARGKLDRSLPSGDEIEFERIYALDALFDTDEDVPEEVAGDRRYAELSGYSIQGVADKMEDEFGEGCVDVLVHSLANGPEVKKNLLETSRAGYLTAVSASAYSMVSMIQRFGPLMNRGGAAVSLTYLASERAIPGYGGGMSAAKAALESDTRTLAYHAGREWGIRVNTISAGPLASRAAKAIGTVERMAAYYSVNSALGGVQTAGDVGHTAAFLCSSLGAGITGTTVYVDRGYHAMGMSVEVLDR